MANEPRCRVCLHPNREQIEEELAGGMRSLQLIADAWSLSRDSVRRHRNDHLPASLRAVRERRENAGAERAIDRLEALYAKALSVLDAAEGDGKASLSLAAIKELRGLVELLAKLTGELDERPQVQVLNVSASPEWAETRARMLHALQPFPEARQAVALALTKGGGDA